MTTSTAFSKAISQGEGGPGRSSRPEAIPSTVAHSAGRDMMPVVARHPASRSCPSLLSPEPADALTCSRRRDGAVARRHLGRRPRPDSAVARGSPRGRLDRKKSTSPRSGSIPRRGQEHGSGRRHLPGAATRSWPTTTKGISSPSGTGRSASRESSCSTGSVRSTAIPRRSKTPSGRSARSKAGQGMEHRSEPGRRDGDSRRGDTSPRPSRRTMTRARGTVPTRSNGKAAAPVSPCSAIRSSTLVESWAHKGSGKNLFGDKATAEELGGAVERHPGHEGDAAGVPVPHERRPRRSRPAEQRRLLLGAPRRTAFRRSCNIWPSRGGRTALGMAPGDPRSDRNVDPAAPRLAEDQAATSRTGSGPTSPERSS